MALGAVTFVLKVSNLILIDPRVPFTCLQAVLDGIARDDRIENMVGIMGDLHGYIADTYPIEKITFYKDTLRKVLVQTTECSYFIGDYRKVTQFGRRLPFLVSFETN